MWADKKIEGRGGAEAEAEERERELGHSCGWGNRNRERPEAGRESHFIRKMPESGDGRTISESQGEAVKTDLGSARLTVPSLKTARAGQPSIWPTMDVCMYKGLYVHYCILVSLQTETRHCLYSQHFLFLFFIYRGSLKSLITL